MKCTVQFYWFRFQASPDTRKFGSLKAAREYFRREWEQLERYHGAEASAEDGIPSAWVFFGDVGDYPDRVMRLGKRGGVVVETV